jgi:hypothetical protein
VYLYRIYKYVKKFTHFHRPKKNPAMPTGLVYVSRMKEIRTKKKRGSRSFFTNVHMASLTRVLIQVFDHNNSDEFIQSFAAPANDLEINMLEAINGKSEGECEDTPDEL